MPATCEEPAQITSMSSQTHPSHFFLEVERVSLNLNGCVVQWRLHKTGNCVYGRNVQARSHNHFSFHGRTVLHILSVCL